MTGTRERTATLNGHEFSYLDSGDGPALLFIHGLTGSQRNCRDPDIGDLVAAVAAV